MCVRAAVVSGITGAGVTLASTFASSLGLSLHQQRIGFALGVALILLGVALFFRQKRTPQPSPLPPVSVTSHYQSGGITAANVNISAPQPQIRGGLAFKDRETDDGVTPRIVVDLDAPYAARAVQVQVRGACILSIEGAPAPEGASDPLTAGLHEHSYSIEEVSSPLTPTSGTSGRGLPWRPRIGSMCGRRGPTICDSGGGAF